TYTGGNSERSFNPAVEEYACDVSPCVKEAEKKRITIVLENEFNFAGPDPTETPEGCIEIIKAVNSPHFRLNFDLCNFYVAGIEPFPYSYELVKDYIAYIHLKNAAMFIEGLHPVGVKIFEEMASHKKYIFVALGEGALNSEAFLSRLKADRYGGYLIVEPHTEEARREEVFSKGIKYIKEKMK
ncbi:MAG: sugar phosphate isomerase/epimerase, partial [Candidatus Mariimomonas ferrooxydans]